MGFIVDVYYGHSVPWVISPEVEAFRSTQHIYSFSKKEPLPTFIEMFNCISNCFPSFAEKTYLDKETDTLYVQPNRDKLASFCSKLFSNEAFQNIGIAKEQRVDGEICDIVYFENKKLEPIIDLNEQDASVFLLSKGVFSEQASEKHLDEGMESLLASQCAQGKYGRYRLLRANSVSSLELFVNSGKSSTTIAFYYKRNP